MNMRMIYERGTMNILHKKIILNGFSNAKEFTWATEKVSSPGQPSENKFAWRRFNSISAPALSSDSEEESQSQVHPDCSSLIIVDFTMYGSIWKTAEYLTHIF